MNENEKNYKTEIAIEHVKKTQCCYEGETFMFLDDVAELINKLFDTSLTKKDILHDSWKFL